MGEHVLGFFYSIFHFRIQEEEKMCSSFFILLIYIFFFNQVLDLLDTGMNIISQCASF